MLLTTITALLIVQDNPTPTGSPGIIEGPSNNPVAAQFVNRYTPAGIKFSEYSINPDSREWIGLTNDGIIIASHDRGIHTAFPSHARFTTFCGTIRKGAAITTSGEVLWWYWGNQNELQSEFTDDRYTQICCCENYGHILGIAEDGTLKYIGAEELTSTLPPVPEGTYAYVTAGVAYPWYAAISSSGTLRAWGNSSGDLTFDGQQVDWTAMCTHSGYELLGLKPDGSVESTNSNSLDGGPYVELASGSGQSRFYGLKSDGTLCGQDGGNYFTTYEGTYQSLRPSLSSLVCAVQTSNVNPATVNPGNLQQVYEGSADSCNRLIQLEPGNYVINGLALNQDHNVRIKGVDKDLCIVILEDSNTSQHLSIENCTIKVNQGFLFDSNLYFEDCDIQLDSPYSKFSRSTEWQTRAFSSSFVARNCELIGDTNTILESSGSSYFVGCTFQSPKSIFVGSGGISLIDCQVPANLTLGQNALVEIASLDPYETPSFADFSGSIFTNVSGYRGPILKCSDPVTLSVWNLSASDCDAVYGGALWFNQADVTLNRAELSRNQASITGNAIYIQNGSYLKVNNSSFVSNISSSPSSHSAIRANYSTVDVENCLFASNVQYPWDPNKSLVLTADSYFCENDPVLLYPGVIDLGGNQVASNCSDFDCNLNGILDDEEVESGNAADCNQNGIPDSCDLDTAFESDCNGNQIPDSCEIADGLLDDCDTDGVPDVCTILDSPSQDSNNDGILDRCQCITDINGDGFTDFSDVLQLLSCWGSDPTGVCGFADVSEDGNIDFSDVLLMLNDFGPC